MLNRNFFLEHHEFYRQNYIKWKIKNLPTDPRKLLKVYRKQDYSFDWPHVHTYFGNFPQWMGHLFLSSPGLFFFWKKCISSRTPGGNWKIAISSGRNWKILEESYFFSIGFSEYDVWNNQLEVTGLPVFLQNSRNWQTILRWQLEFSIYMPWHIWWGTVSSPASISGTWKTAHDK